MILFGLLCVLLCLFLGGAILCSGRSRISTNVSLVAMSRSVTNVSLVAMSRSVTNVSLVVLSRSVTIFFWSECASKAEDRDHACQMAQSGFKSVENTNSNNQKSGNVEQAGACSISGNG